MRAIFLLLSFSLPGCFLVDPDGDGRVGKDDCDPNSRSTECEDEGVETDTYVVDTGETGWIDTGETGTPCEPVSWYVDADGDGYGDPANSVEECDQPDGYVADATDCDDGAANVHPGSGEWCNGVDDDCDDSTDENTSTSWYTDADRDGFGDEATAVDVICDGQSGTLVAPQDVTGEGAYDFDCDDGDADIFPLADEYCDGEDDDCDGVTDEDDALDADVWYADADGDGYGDADETAESCDQPAAYVAISTDCDDTDAGNFPGNAESCDGADNDCDGSPASDETDDDLDGYTECADADCDDAAIDTFPGAPESCDDADNDCDGVVDENDAGDVATWYHDADGDGYGDAGASWSSCTAPLGYVADATDCDDADDSVNPGAIEVCNEIDDDCDGDVDVAAADATVWSVDADGDGAGSDSYADWLASCSQPDGYVQDFDDCDDTEADVNPDATEVYDDLVDNDCNGTIDDSAITCYPDADNDGFGDSTGGVYEETGVCAESYVDHDSDCDDSNSTTNPDEDDPYGDGVDSDCNGSAT